VIIFQKNIKIIKNKMNNSREEYDKRKIRYFLKDNCPFCTNLKENNEKILFKNNFWIVIKNKYPYFNCSK